MNSIAQPPAKPIAVQIASVLATSQGEGPDDELLAAPPMQLRQRNPTGHWVMQLVQIAASHSLHFNRESV